jgi:hypothetical protein
MDINWDEFKLYKQEMPHLKGDNFDKLLYFVRSFYNIKSPTQLFELLRRDEISMLMLQKRSITTPVELEKYMQKL